MGSDTPSVLELFVGGLVLLLLLGLLLSGPGQSNVSSRPEPAKPPALLREDVAQRLQAQGVPRAAAWPLSYFIAGDLVAEKLLPGITVEQALLLHRAFPNFTTEWDGLWRLIWRGKSIQFMLDSSRRAWPWADLLAGRIRIGMPAEQVLVAWGNPTTVNRTVTVGRVREQWVYEEGEPIIPLPDMWQEPRNLGTMLRMAALGRFPFSLYRARTYYLYFENGILIAIQELE